MNLYIRQIMFHTLRVIPLLLSFNWYWILPLALVIPNINLHNTSNQHTTNVREASITEHLNKTRYLISSNFSVMVTRYNYFQIDVYFFPAQTQTNPISTGYCNVMGQDSIVGTATRYGLDDLGIESWWGVRFSAPIQIGPGVYPAS